MNRKMTLSQVGKGRTIWQVNARNYYDKVKELEFKYGC